MKKDFLPTGVILVSIIVGIVAFPSLPHELPIHWSNGEPDKYANKTLAILLIPILMLISNFLSLFFLKTKQVNGNYNNMTILNKINMVMLSLLFVIHLVIIAFGLGFEFNIHFLIGALLGLFIIIVANSMQKTKPNHAYGLRTPWTLKDEKVWKQANRFGAKLFVVIGFLIIGLSFVIPEYITIVIIGLLLGGVLIAVYASYLIYKKLNIVDQ
ncbi:SdpI family protein [Bacillus sp. WMMC1349]|uniref:SdpI family protein n=1 Tax=Bacillus sp. WMMC1349 TaxID=2736254 RepID=UPI001554CD41|nr:SdpI family protein [Bacillus sp. WMMC1349]NPC93438.1 SdpI family protein [Bacillus sp. WMMC1349]